MKLEKLRPSNRVFRMYLMTLVIFILLIFTIFSIKEVTRRYYDESMYYYKEQQWEIVFANIRTIYNFSKYNTEIIAENIEDDILELLDLELLRNSLENNLYYNEFNEILKDHLNDNPFLSDPAMNGKRNGMLVIANNHIIGSYPYNEYYGHYTHENLNFSIDNTLEDLVNNAYNVELTSKAIHDITTQSEEYIIWQLREPHNPNAIKYEVLNVARLKTIFEEEGIHGFASYGLLVPAYITEYGNIFDEPDELTDRHNKIIIVQKINLTDYFTVLLPDLFDNHEINSLNRIYGVIELSILLFEIILYISIVVYVIFVVYNINYILDKKSNKIN